MKNMIIVNIILGIFIIAALEKILKESKYLIGSIPKAKNYQEITYESLELDSQQHFKDDDIDYEIAEESFEEWENFTFIEENEIAETDMLFSIETINDNDNDNYIPQTNQKFQKRELKKAIIYKEIIDRPLGIRRFNKYNRK